MPTPPAKDPVFEDILGWAKGIAIQEGVEELDTPHILLGALRSPQGIALLEKLLRAKERRDLAVDPDKRKQLDLVKAPVTDRSLDLTERLRGIIHEVWVRHGSLRADAVLEAIINSLRDEEQWVNKLLESHGERLLAAGQHGVHTVRSLLDETEALRRSLRERIIGQDRAIDMVCDGYFSSQLRRGSEAKRGEGDQGPRMILTFLGPSGVGKTYLAEIMARHLHQGEETPALLRLDMSAYSGHQAHEQLVGFNPTYTGSNRGLLTGFVLDHENAFILVDEIEKAHPNTQHLFLQILDSGKAYDNKEQKEVDFSKAIVIFTTNLGRELYDAPERAGILSESGRLNDAVLQALRKETGHPGEDRPGLSPELLSRMAKGYVVLFSRLGGLALERIADMTLRDVSGELETGVGLVVRPPDPIVLTLLVLRFGAGGDARRLTTGLRNYLYTTVKDLLHDHRSLLLEGKDPLLSNVKGLQISIPASTQIPATIRDGLARKSKVLLLDDDRWDLEGGRDFAWNQVVDQEQADQILRKGDTDLILLDLHIGFTKDAKEMERGQTLLRWLRSRYPQVPVYLFSETPEKRGLSQEALERVSQEGGAHGILQKRFFGNSESEATEKSGFFLQLREVDAQIHRQNLVEHYQRRFMVLDFDLHFDPAPDREGYLRLEITGIREVTAVTAQDRELAGWVDLPKERFEDIAGAEQAKGRLREVVAWLSDPRPVVELGLELPKGILLTGPPGTGKTSLARAVAGESRVPFFAISGASVFKKYLGESEATIRNLFAVARRYAPSVVFIDEIDAIGGHRTDSSLDGGARVGVLNELLAQMDGFVQAGRPVFVMAATNRPDMLDAALVRAGRFDLQIEVPLPNAEAREGIFKVHLRGLQVDLGVDIAKLAARTAGLSGADIEQICKEAGFIAVREGKREITHKHLDEAVTIVRFGLSSERVLLDEATKWSTSVHEAGHALTQHLLFPDEPVSQISILPRGRALGFTEHTPAKFYTDQSLKRMRGTLQVLLAGRVAEEIFLGPEGVTAGCADDLQRASSLVIQMITAWGMDPEIGLLSLEGIQRGLAVSPGMPVESATHEQAIAAARKWLAAEEEGVRKLLESRKEVLERIAKSVMAKETLGGEELEQLFN